MMKKFFCKEAMHVLMANVLDENGENVYEVNIDGSHKRDAFGGKIPMQRMIKFKTFHPGDSKDKFDCSSYIELNEEDKNDLQIINTIEKSMQRSNIYLNEEKFLSTRDPFFAAAQKAQKAQKDQATLIKELKAKIAERDKVIKDLEKTSKKD